MKTITKLKAVDITSSKNQVVLTLFLALASAPDLINSLATSMLFIQAALCNGVHPD